MPPVIARSIDLGHGSVKYACVSGGVLAYREFPALAIATQSKNFHVKDLSVPRVRTLAVEVNDHMYQVGPDAQAMQQNFGGRELLESYSRGDRYAALMKGALAYIGEPVIDSLVLALPLTTFERERTRLEEAWTRRIEVPNPTQSGVRMTVDIRRTIVVPQPLGTYTQAIQEGKIQPELGNTLVIDPGYHTVDWVVMTPQGAVMMGLSGALQGGVHALMRLIAKALEPQVGQTVENLAPIEEAWRTGGPVFRRGREYSLKPHMAAVEEAIDGMVTEMYARLGLSTQVRQIVVAGGGAPAFAGAIRTRLGDQVKVLDQPEFSNVKGFQAIATSLARRMQNASASA